MAWVGKKHYLNQTWLMVIWTPRNKLQRHLNQNTKFFYWFENVVHQKFIILMVCQWVERTWVHTLCSCDTANVRAFSINPKALLWSGAGHETFSASNILFLKSINSLWMNGWMNGWMDGSINQPFNQSINQSINQPFNQSINQPVNQS